MVFRMRVKILVISIFAMFLVIAGAILYDNIVWQANSKPAGDLIQAIGYSGLSLSSDCTYTRNPIFVGACQTDTPGGYCYYESCGMVNPVADGTPYHMMVTHLGNRTVG
jgi:hypothetical protein